MDRKHFLKSTAVCAFVAPFSSAMAGMARMETLAIVPPALKPGDRIGICSPAGYIMQEDILPAKERISTWKFEAVIGKTIGKRDFSFGGSDQERIDDFQEMLDDTEIRAILCARGGYGLIRIIDKLDFSKFRRNPKWIIGFSDITVLHCHLNRNLGIASIHAKMCNSFPKIWADADPVQQETIDSIFKALCGEKTRLQTPPSVANRSGTGEGALVGGNLKTIETLAGSPSDLRTANKILFIEDVGEYLYSIDRMFWNLQRSGKLDQLSGLIVGGFRIKPDEAGNEFGRSLEQIVMEKVSAYSYPVCFNFPVGHQKDNYALKSGIPHRLVVTEKGTELIEL